MKRCEICFELDRVHYRVRSEKYNNWIFCCRVCWETISEHEQYCYGGTRKSQ